MPDDAPKLQAERAGQQSATRQPGRLGRVLGALIGLALLAGTGAAIWLWPDIGQSNRNRQPRPDAFPVLVASARSQDVPIWLDALGTVQASSTVTIKPLVDGTLIEVAFREGQDVKAGDLLARIDPRSFQAALDQAEAKKAQDTAQLENARLDLTRYTNLARNNFASTQQADTARAQVAQLEAQLRQDQAQIDATRTQLSYTTITAPVDGRVGVRLVDQGNIVHPSDATGLVVITTLQPISVMFTLPQQSLPAVVAAMKAGSPDVLGPEVLALAQSADATGSGRLLDRGRLEVIDNQVDPTTGTIRLKASFPNPDRLLWPGGFVGVRLRVDTLRDVITVPPAAVHRGPRGAFLYVLKQDDTVSQRTITVGYEDQELSVVTSGVQAGARVITDGTARLSEGARVFIAERAPVAPPSARRRVGGAAGQ